MPVQRPGMALFAMHPWLELVFVAPLLGDKEHHRMIFPLMQAVMPWVACDQIAQENDVDIAANLCFLKQTDVLLTGLKIGLQPQAQTIGKITVSIDYHDGQRLFHGMSSFQPACLPYVEHRGRHGIDKCQ